MSADEDARAVATALRSLLQRLPRPRPGVAGLVPLASSETQVLRCVEADPGVTVTRIAEVLDMRQSNTSTTVRALVERGLVRREADAADGRVSHLHVTARARRHLGGLEDAETSVLLEALAGLSATDVRALVRAVPALRHLDAVLHDGDR